MEWVRGREIGSGAFSTVSLATRCSKSEDDGRFVQPLTLAVKSCDGRSDDGSEKLLKDEHDVLTQLGPHPNIVNCYGRSEGNLLLEYAPLGSLDRSGPKVAEGVLRKYTRHVLRALVHVHSRGFVHCDIKPQNILLFPGSGGEAGTAKVADFGLARRAGSKEGGFRGTPFYVSPEAVNGGEYRPSWDVWAVGCVVAEMASGRKAMRMREGENGWRFMVRIGDGEVVPEMPEELAEEGRDFLSRCWTRDPAERWTTEILLRHPFVVADCDDDCHDKDDSPSVSPRCHFDFAELHSFESWGSESSTGTVQLSLSLRSGSWSPEELSGPESETEDNLVDSGLSFGCRDRIETLAADRMPEWDDDSCSWMQAR